MCDACHQYTYNMNINGILIAHTFWAIFGISDNDGRRGSKTDRTVDRRQSLFQYFKWLIKVRKEGRGYNGYRMEFVRLVSPLKIVFTATDCSVMDLFFLTDQ